MPFKKGEGGRPKGAVNKTTVAAKEAFQLAFEKLGGVERLVDWCNSDPDNYKAFIQQYSKLIPMTHSVDEGEFGLTVIRPSRDEANAKAG